MQRRADAVGVVSSDGTALRVGSHSLRVTFITWALEAGAHPADIAKQTGHADLDMIARYDRRGRTVQARVGALAALSSLVDDGAQDP